MKYKNELGMPTIHLEKDGEVGYIKVGNTVIDVKRGYRHGKEKEPVAIINVYPYSDSKPQRILIYDNGGLILARYNPKEVKLKEK